MAAKINKTLYFTVYLYTLYFIHFQGNVTLSKMIKPRAKVGFSFQLLLILSALPVCFVTYLGYVTVKYVLLYF